MHDNDISRLDDLPPVTELEDRLNKKVFDLYDIDDTNVDVIEIFLERF